MALGLYFSLSLSLSLSLSMCCIGLHCVNLSLVCKTHCPICFRNLYIAFFQSKHLEQRSLSLSLAHFCSTFSFCTSEYYNSEVSCPFKVRVHMPPQIFGQVDFECSFQKTKNCRIIFSIFDSITPVWFKSFSASYHQLLNSNLRSLAGTEPETDAFIQLCTL